MEIKWLFSKRQIMYMPGKYPGAIKHYAKLIAWWFYDLSKVINAHKIKTPRYQISLYKKWNHDIEMWEEKIKIFGVFNYYKYSIWREGKTIIKFNLWKNS